MMVDSIFAQCDDNNVKFIALQILDEAIKVSEQKKERIKQRASFYIAHIKEI